MPFAVYVMPPERPSAVFSTSTPLTPLSSAPQSSPDPPKVIAAPIKLEQTIGDLIVATEQRFRQKYGDQAAQGMCFDRLKGPFGEEYLTTDIIGEMFDVEARKVGVKLYVYLEPDSKKRALDSEDMTERDNTFKRHKVEADVHHPPPSAQQVRSPKVDKLGSSQAKLSSVKSTPSLPSSNPQKSARAIAAATAPSWTAEEDAIILKGVRECWDSGKIAKALGPSQRSSGAVRGRKAVLLKRKPRYQSFPKPMKSSRLHSDIRTAFVRVTPRNHATATEPESDSQAEIDAQLEGEAEAEANAEIESGAGEVDAESERSVDMEPTLDAAPEDEAKVEAGAESEDKPGTEGDAAPEDDAKLESGPSPARESPAVTVTLPHPQQARGLGHRTDKERWREAYEGTGGNAQMARDNYNAIVNRENMLDAVMHDDHAEIARLNAQRRRLQRQRSQSNGTRAPRRHNPLAGHKHLPVKMEVADEEVVRDDDYSTADEDKANSVFYDSDDMVEDEEMDGSEAEIDIVDGPGKILDEEEVDEKPGPGALDAPEIITVTPPRPKARQETAGETRARLREQACPYPSDDESVSEDSE